MSYQHQSDWVVERFFIGLGPLVAVISRAAEVTVEVVRWKPGIKLDAFALVRALDVPVFITSGLVYTSGVRNKR